MHYSQPSGLGARLGSRTSVRGAVRIASPACVHPRPLGSLRRSPLPLRAAAPEVETAEEPVEFNEVGCATSCSIADQSPSQANCSIIERASQRLLCHRYEQR